MDDYAQSTCFGFGMRKEQKNKRKQQMETRKSKASAKLDISPLSSINSDEAIKALHLSPREEQPPLSKAEQAELAAELSRERAQRQSLEAHLAAALNVNAEMKLAASLSSEDGGSTLLSKKLAKLRTQLTKERKDHEETSQQLAAAKREAGAMRAALNAARTQRDELEAELMEAALDVMDGEKQKAQLETAMRSEKQSRRAAEGATAEAEVLRVQLRSTEVAREALEEKLSAMSAEARDWELALDSLQERLEKALTTRPLDSVAVSSFDLYAPSTPSRFGKPLSSGTKSRSCCADDVAPRPDAKPEPAWRQVVVRPAAVA